MNPVTFNDKIKQMTVKPTASGSMEAVFPNWEHSPLFLYEEPDSEAETTAIIKNMDANCFESTPFPVFRLDVTVGSKHHKEYGKYRCKMLVRHYRPEEAPLGESSLCVIARVDGLLHTPSTYALRPRTGDRVEGIPIYMAAYNVRQSDKGSSDFTCDAELRFGLNGRWWDKKDYQLAREKGMMQGLIGSYLNGTLKSLAAFNLSAMAPANHVVEVRPNAPARSVEWIKARTHYTLITHGHPANSAAVGHGSRVATPDKGEELTRMAHNRREHKRTYRHARFRYARGKTITVRAAWIGPKEWQDEGGHQIYRILEPVEEESWTTTDGLLTNTAA